MYLTYDIDTLRIAIKCCPDVIVNTCCTKYRVSVRDLTAEYIWNQNTMPIILQHYLLHPPIIVWMELCETMCSEYACSSLYDDNIQSTTKNMVKDTIKFNIPSYEYLSDTKLKNMLHGNKLSMEKLQPPRKFMPRDLTLTGALISSKVCNLQLSIWPRLSLTSVQKIICEQLITLEDFFALNVNALKTICLVFSINRAGTKIELQQKIIQKRSDDIIWTPNQTMQNILRSQQYWDIYSLVMDDGWRKRNIQFTNLVVKKVRDYPSVILQYMLDFSNWILDPELLLQTKSDSDLNVYSLYQLPANHITDLLSQTHIQSYIKYMSLDITGSNRITDETLNIPSKLILAEALDRYSQWKIQIDTPEIRSESAHLQLLYLIHHKLIVHGLNLDTHSKLISYAVNLHYWFNHNDKGSNEVSSFPRWIINHLDDVSSTTDPVDDEYCLPLSSATGKYLLTSEQLSVLAKQYIQHRSLPIRLSHYILSLSRPHLIILSTIFKLPSWIGQFTERIDLIGYLTIQGYDFPVGKYLDIYRRRQTYNNLRPIELDYVAHIYGLAFEHSRQDVVCSMLSFDQHPLETWIIERKYHDMTLMTNTLGMSSTPHNKMLYDTANIHMLPKIDGHQVSGTSNTVICGVDKNKMETYFCAHIKQYYDVWKHCTSIKAQLPVLDQLCDFTQEDIYRILNIHSDEAILFHINAHLLYKTRSELLEQITSLVRWPGIFVPQIVPVNILQRREQDEGWEEFTTMPFFLAYGTLHDYVLVSIQELSLCFSQDTNGTFNFSLPHLQNQDLDLSTVHDLREILYYYTSVFNTDTMIRHHIDKLQHKIKLGLSHYTHIDNVLNRTLKRFKILSDSDKDFIRQWLEQLFFAGMYMRRWTGPSEIFPLTKHSTERLDINPDDRTTPTLLKMKHMLELGSDKTREILLPLFIVEWEGKRQNISDKISVGKMFNKLLEGTYCIRQYSSFCVGSSFHYTQLFFKCNIGCSNSLLSMDEFHPNKVVRILHAPEES